MAQHSNGGIATFIFKENWEIQYIFISNIIASGVTLLLLLPIYFKVRLDFDFTLWKQMMKYAGPILIAGIAFTIKEELDKILLTELLPVSIAESEVLKYAACYK